MPGQLSAAALSVPGNLWAPLAAAVVSVALAAYGARSRRRWMREHTPGGEPGGPRPPSRPGRQGSQQRRSQ